MVQTKDMTKGTPWKLIVSFAIPIFLSNLFQQLYNSCDSAIVGHFLGTNALAAVSSSGSLIFMFTSFFIGAAMGGAVMISKLFGEKNYDGMHKAIHTSIAIGLISSVVLTILGVLLTPQILVWMNTDSEVLPNSISYFRVYFCGVSGSIMYNFFNSILQAIGNSRRGLYYLIISSLTNIILDFLFVGVLNYGVGSAALATIISQYLSAILCLIFLLKKGTIYQVRIKDIRIDKNSLRLILRYGIPSGIQNSVIGFANVIVQSNINTFGGIVQAGCGSYSKLEGFAFLPITCFNMAITTFVGQNLGAKEYDRAKRGSRFGIITATILAEVIGVIMFFFTGTFAKMFSDDPEVLKVTAMQARTICLFYFLLSYSHCVASVCRGAGKAIVPMFIMLAVWCGIRIIYIKVAMYINPDNIRLIFIAYPLTWSISSIIYFIYYYFSDWVHGFEPKHLEMD